MTLDEWLASQGPGAKSQLVKDSGLSWPAVDRACKGRCTLESAQIISPLTGGQVPVEAMVRASTIEKMRRAS